MYSFPVFCVVNPPARYVLKSPLHAGVKSISQEAESLIHRMESEDGRENVGASKIGRNFAELSQRDVDDVAFKIKKFRIVEWVAENSGFPA
jgi:hypothetical protein